MIIIDKAAGSVALQENCFLSPATTLQSWRECRLAAQSREDWRNHDQYVHISSPLFVRAGYSLSALHSYDSAGLYGLSIWAAKEHGAILWDEIGPNDAEAFIADKVQTQHELLRKDLGEPPYEFRWGIASIGRDPWFPVSRYIYVKYRDYLRPRQESSA